MAAATDPILNINNRCLRLTDNTLLMEHPRIVPTEFAETSALPEEYTNNCSQDATDEQEDPISTIAVLADTIMRPLSMDATPTKSRLTLSAFRRHAICLTKADPNRRLSDEYDLHASGSRGVLGHGAFSTVRLAVRAADGVKVAIKTIAKHEALRSRRLRVRGRRYVEEWEILQRFQDHPHIISLLDVFETDEEIQLVLEYCEGGELFAALQQKPCRSESARRYTEAQTSQITCQILQALCNLHEADIVHRDVKAENILLVSNKEENDIHVKLCDFGVARPLFDQETESDSDHTDEEEGPATPSPVVTPGRIQRSYSIVGSDYYTAPEVGFSDCYSPAIDVYSLGVTVYILLCGFPPIFAGENETEVMFPSSYWNDISPEAKALVAKMLQPVPSDRISAKEAMSDPWITSHLKILPKLQPRYPHSTNLDLVCRRLYTSVTAEAATQAGSRKRSYSVISSSTAQSPCRPRARSSSVVMALADICRNITALEAGDHHPFLVEGPMTAMQASLSGGGVHRYDSNVEEPTSSAPVAAL
ncbi:hypothetical protein MPSEU_000272500 [Mayamaea pseudoterrestris]|nr:hypothetical protein MPSEU_000272500 [Mayamaea pseudoterrestris]